MTEIKSQMGTVPGPEHAVKVYTSRPVGVGTFPGLVLVHEIWGLTPHIKSVADRFAREGYVVFAPDLMGSDPALAPYFTDETVAAVAAFMRTLTTGRMRDQSYFQEQLAKLPEEKRTVVGAWYGKVFGGSMPYERFVKELVSVVESARSHEGVKRDRIGSLGFCFGGTMSGRLACTGTTQAAVVFYGQNPDPVDSIEKANCPFLGLYGADDVMLNANLDKLVAAMTKYKKDFEMKIYQGAPHAFFNDTNPQTYREAAAKDAWVRSLAFLDRCLGHA